jgi:RNA-directed DNA polymerase
MPEYVGSGQGYQGRESFDHISHEWMLNNITTDTQVLKKWLESGVIEQRKFCPTTEGTPQGSIVSPTLSNLVLDGLEDRLSQEFGARRHNQRLLQKTKVHLVRYADDFVITGSSKELLEGIVKPMVEEYLTERGLQLSEEKTRITHISEGFDFLGWNVRKFRFGKPNSKLLIRPSKKNVKAFLAKVRDVVSRNRTVRQYNLIQILNPMIQGWANYHRHVVASEIFGKVDAAVWWMLWRWAVRRHPKKNTKWVRRRYFGRVENRASVFKCIAEGRNGWLELRIRTCSEVAIKRHVKIQAEATAFNPRFEAYFEARQSARMENHLAGHRKLLYLWRRQGGRCPICGEPITKLTRWHVHHLIRQVDGGSDSVSNLCLVHPTCHHQHHANPNLKWKLPVEPDGLT